MDGDNSTGEWLSATPGNQQERLNDYLSGYVDGEGSFHVAVQRNSSTKFGWQLVPEFHVSQNPERASILVIMQRRLGCGRVRANAGRGKRDKSLVFVVRKRRDLLTKVIPFFEQHPIVSEKRLEFETFAHIVRAMDRGEHLTRIGFERLLQLAVQMNGGGRYRKIDWSSRILRGYTPNTESRFREDIVRPPWRHGEPGGTETTWPLDHAMQAELPIER
jgi:LAGLIDADG endonuclease